METIKLTYPHQLTFEQLPETIAAIGFFDGVHKGHQAVIQNAIHKAKEKNKQSAVISFHPHPSVVLQSKKDVQYITPLDEKEKLLKDMGVDRFYVVTFNTDLSLLTPQEFVDHFIIELHIQELIAGFDFTFGHKGAGNMDNIQLFSQGKFGTTTIDQIDFHEDKISSTRIRNLLRSGDVHLLEPLLGRHYQAKGTVIEGAKRGRKLGFPTANIEVREDKFLPKQGVYAVKVILDDGIFLGMANLGVIPTFVSGKSKPSLEVYILDFNKDIYGEQVAIEWHSFVREEKKFNGINEIVQQLKQDEQTVRRYFA